ncbi:helix-turn-helix domain-containing protein [Flavobacterium sp. ASW18X]|uniref:helix-turn-helix domain-containing protein n=1 Tax=Flavobacterium sp. ASW18X TaxID=2572595 RepID=UPI0010AE6BE6|nr:helix-turn-helix domain-containing protein [Flavobacterium sp. ASW18X]TKD67328.1 helix-turn-helix domain-containing protein [Flavobacterium sp. ASW18X]
MQTLQFIGTTPNQLKNEITENVKFLIEELKANFQPKAPEEFLTRKKTAEILQINLSTLYLWTKRGLLKSYGIAGKVYYKRSEIEKALIEL